MSATDAGIESRIRRKLKQFERLHGMLPGLVDDAARDVFVHQVIESVHRREFVKRLLSRDVSPYRADPNSALFDPLRGAVWHLRRGNLDEAVWLVFLFVHFGRHRTGGWRYAREVYGRLGQGPPFTWLEISENVNSFRDWLSLHEAQIQRRPPPGGFGNHRKYQSLSATSSTGTGATVASFVDWVGDSGSPTMAIGSYAKNLEPTRAFRALFNEMSSVVGFGRTARFDFLSMLWKLELADIVPDSTYLAGATGPRAGAALLFGSPRGLPVTELQERTDHFASFLGEGMQVAEDALCNWQKSPTDFIAFRG